MNEEVAAVILFGLGLALVPIGSFFWLPDQSVPLYRALGPFFYWFGLACMVNGFCHMIRPLKWALIGFSVLGIALGVVGVIWSEDNNTDIRNQFSFASVGILAGTVFAFLELWGRRRKP